MQKDAKNHKSQPNCQASVQQQELVPVPSETSSLPEQHMGIVTRYSLSNVELVKINFVFAIIIIMDLTEKFGKKIP